MAASTKGGARLSAERLALWNYVCMDVRGWAGSKAFRMRHNGVFANRWLSTTNRWASTSSFDMFLSVSLCLRLALVFQGHSSYFGNYGIRAPRSIGFRSKMLYCPKNINISQQKCCTVLKAQKSNVLLTMARSRGKGRGVLPYLLVKNAVLS